MKYYLAVLVYFILSSELFSQNIIRVEGKFLPCLSTYDKLITEDNILEHTFDFDTIIDSDGFCNEIQVFSLLHELNKPYVSVIDARIYLKCYYQNEGNIIITADYYGRYSINGKRYDKNEELIKILTKYIPFVEDCINRLK